MLATQTSTTWATAPWDIAPSFPDGGGTATLNGATNITGVVPAITTLTLDVTPTLSGITYNSPFSYAIAPSGANTLALTTTGTNTFNAQLTIANTLTLFQLANVITAPISGGGAFGLTKTGDYSISLSGTNTYTGGTHINGGFLAISAALAIGDATLGATGPGNGISFNGGSLISNITTAWTTSRDIFIDVGGATLYSVTAANLNGILSGTGNFRLSGFAGAVTLTGANTFTGTTITDGPSTLTLSGAAGTINQNSAYNFAGVVNLSNATANNNDRLSDTAAINSRGATITLTGNATAATPTSEVAGALNLANGNTTITVTPNAANPASLNFADINRLNNSTMFVRGTSLGAAPANGVAQIISTASPGTLVGGGGAPGSTNISILPYAVGNTSAAATVGSSLVTWDSGTGQLRPLATTEYAAAFGVATDNVRLTASTAAGAGDTANALLFAPAAAATLSGGPINITSGVFLYSPTVASTGTVSAGLNFGSAEGIIHASSSLGISGAIAGSNGVTINGLAGSVITLTGASTYTGSTIINGGQVTLAGTIDPGTAGPLGMTSAPIILNAGTTTARLWVNGDTTFNRDFVIMGDPNLSSTAGLGSTGTNNITINGNVDLQRRLTIENGPSLPFTINGIVSGPGFLTEAFSSLVVLNNTNTYSGGTNIQTGTYAAGSDTAFGTGTIYFSNTGSLRSADATAHTIANTIFLGANPTFSGTGAMNFSGNLNLNSSRTLTISNTAAAGVTFSGLVSNGALTKAGTGTLTLSGANNTYTGGTVLSASGIVNANAAGTLGAGTLTLSNATAVANINANQSIAGLSGAVTGATTNIASGVNLTLNVPGTVTYGGIIAGMGSLTKTGSGTQAIQAGSNTYSGGTFVNAGTLTFNQDTSLGTGAVTLGTAGGGNATLVTTNGTASPANNIIVASTALAATYTPAAGTLTLGSTSTAATGGTYSGLITLNQSVNLTSQNTGATTGLKFTGNITGAGGINKVQTGVAVFNPTAGINDYAGGTSISAGQITALKDSALGTGNVSLLASGVTLLLQGGVTNNYISDNATLSIVSGAAANLNFAGTDSVGGLVLGGVTQTDVGATYGFTGSGANHEFADFFLGTGTVTLIPEPSTWAMTIVGASLLIGAQRFRRRRTR